MKDATPAAATPLEDPLDKSSKKRKAKKVKQKDGRVAAKDLEVRPGKERPSNATRKKKKKRATKETASEIANGEDTAKGEVKRLHKPKEKIKKKKRKPESEEKPQRLEAVKKRKKSEKTENSSDKTQKTEKRKKQKGETPLEQSVDTEPAAPKESDSAPDDHRVAPNEEPPLSRPTRSFRRVANEEWLGKKGAQNNSYEANFGSTGWGAKAQQVLSKVRGKNFRHEKTKKKRGTYFGGKISADAVNSIKFESDED